MTQRKRITVAVLLSAATLCGCGGAAVPSAHVATATGAVRAAQEAGAENVPTASLELRYAREEMASAQQSINEGHNERAELQLRRAVADAELARAEAREQNAQAQARSAQVELRTLQSQ